MNEGRHDEPPRSANDDESPFLAYAMPQAESASGRSTALDQLLRTFLASALVGGLTIALTGVPYYLELRHQIVMDWTREGFLFFFFGCGIGAATGAGSIGGMLLVRRWLGSSRGLVRALVTVLGAMLGVAILGTMPGSIGTAYFGAKQAPFVGLAAISVVPFTGALVLAALVARADVRASEERVGWGWCVLSSLLAVVPLAGAGVALALAVPDDVALAWMRAGARDLAPGPEGFAGGLVLLGGGMGAALGAALGLHAGLTTVLVRLRATAPSATD